VELYYEVQRLLEERENFRKGILAMGGHVDGMLVWGESADEAGFTLLSFFIDLSPESASRFLTPS
jgi:hypothetical protein